VLVPSAESIDPSIEYYADYSQNHDEFQRAFAALGQPWRWQLVTTANYREVLDAAVAEFGTQGLVVFNMCDGDDSDNVPGIGVIHHLDTLGVAYTGADVAFYQGTTSKIDMKASFDAAGVSTSPWQVVERSARDASKLFSRLGSPLIVKPAISAGSMGISIKSVVADAKALREQVGRLHDGYHGWDLVSGGVMVERYIAGPEFTTFIVGSADNPERARVYLPVERVFHASLPPTEQFLSYDRLWEVHEQESPIGDGESLWEYRPAPVRLRKRIKALSWDAYAAVGGHGYGRVDLRMDAATGEIYVLEVNAQCGLSEDENYTSIGAILRYARRSFASMVREIVDVALAERPVTQGMGRQ
jgi:D-alanine-D-alanine ligase